MLSVFSLYETILKQARPAVYVGGHALCPRSGGRRRGLRHTPDDHQSRSAGCDHHQSRPGCAPDKSGRPASLTFASAYVGSNPAREKQPFTPLSIPGRGSFTGIVLFYPNDPGTARRTRWSSARRLTAGTVLSGQRHDSRSRLPGGQRILRDGVWCSPLPVGKADAGMNPEHILRGLGLSGSTISVGLDPQLHRDRLNSLTILPTLLARANEVVGCSYESAAGKKQETSAAQQLQQLSGLQETYPLRARTCKNRGATRVSATVGNATPR